MLRRLTVENYALIEKLDLEPGPSLNIITGETGAGKSILLGALGLVLGNRADTMALRDNTVNCVIEGTFNIEGYGLEPLFEEYDLDYEPLTVIRRVITPAGKSRTYVNDLPVQLSTLKDLSERLIDIHSQQQTRMLSDERFRTRIVDSLAGNSLLIEKYSSLFKELMAVEHEISRLQEEAEKNRRDEDYIRIQFEELASVKLRPGELDELESEQKKLANAGEILAGLAESENSLDDENGGVLSRLKDMEVTFRRMESVYPRSSELRERINSAYVELKDIYSEVSSEAGRMEVNPEKLAATDDRLATIYDLFKKHHVSTVGELIELEKQFGARLDIITGSDETISALRDKAANLNALAVAAAEKISASRRKSAGILDKKIEGILAKLGMPSNRFITDISPARELTSTGADEIAFLFSANNTSPQPLERIASGGETSRAMLALKSVIAENTMLPTIIFDEIDTGVSGRIADATGEIIAGLADNMQVINITHLPQVASKGDTHFIVYKEENNGVTKTHIRKLSTEERINEIAKMLSGSRVTDAALQQARSLLGLKS